MNNTIRNFVIIAHIDHGKSTLADRMLEVTGTIDARHMKPQYLDQLELEQERGITIKMAPVRMSYTPAGQSQSYTLNLIDTPGHSDFSYEVSRALAAVEGAVLLVDATKGIQAQTLSNFRAARRAGLTIVGAVNKVDMNPPALEQCVESLAELIGVPSKDILRISAKTGAGVSQLLDVVVERVPSPAVSSESAGTALIFDSLYDDHKGIIAYVRVMSGSFCVGESVSSIATGAQIKVKEVGGFLPQLKSMHDLPAGMIGYIATGLKEPSLVKIGDTLYHTGTPATPLTGYREPGPVVFIAFYPDGSSTFEDLYKGFSRLQLNDPALTVEPDANEALGRGLKVGFLGQLHFEITSDRLEREFGLEFITSFPSIAYRILTPKGEVIAKQSQDWPEHTLNVFQPMVRVEIVTPAASLSTVAALQTMFKMEIVSVDSISDSARLIARMPLSELIRDFDDQLKTVSHGYASFSYEPEEEMVADVKKMEIVVAESVQPALTRIVATDDVEREARQTVERLKELLPRQQFAQAVQAVVAGRIVARETIPAIKKNLGDFGKNGGDRTRKMKLWKKQKRGKEKLQGLGRVDVPVSVFRELLKK